MIVGITGTIGAGKGTIAEFLKTKGFKHYSVGNFLEKELKERGLMTDRDNKMLLANQLRSKHGSGYIVEQLYEVAKKEGGDAIIESIRAIGEVEVLKAKGDFFLFAIDADPEIRYSRLIERGLNPELLSYEDFLVQEERELESDDESRQNIRGCIELSDYLFKNNWTREELIGKLSSVLNKIYTKRESLKQPIEVSNTKNFASGIIPDFQIKEKVRTGKIKIIPYDSACVQPASYDLHLDKQFKIFRPHRTEIIDTKKPVGDLMEEVDLGGRDSFVLHPGSFALGLIKEITGVDNKHVGRLEGKSSLARLGLIIHTTAGFLDPGNSLQLTLELYNASPLPIKLYPGMKIAQIAFEELQAPCEIPYGKERGSSYYGANKIQESQMHKNFERFDEKTGLYN